jgi:hypothetical protein
MSTVIPPRVPPTTNTQRTSFACSINWQTGTLGREEISRSKTQIKYTEPKCITEYTPQAKYCDDSNCYIYTNTPIVDGIMTITIVISFLVILTLAFRGWLPVVSNYFLKKQRIDPPFWEILCDIFIGIFYFFVLWQFLIIFGAVFF